MSSEHTCPRCGFHFQDNCTLYNRYNQYIYDWYPFKIKEDVKFYCVCEYCGKRHTEGYVRLDPRFDTRMMKGFSKIWYTEHPRYEYCCTECAKEKGIVE